MAGKSIGINFVWITSFILIFNSCSTDRNKKVVDSYSPEISFSDQVELVIEDKYFTIRIDSAFGDFGFSYFSFRIDLSIPNLVRYWARRYNNMVEIRFYNREHYEIGEHDYNYLFGMKDFSPNDSTKLVKGFYIRWRNFLAKRNPNLTGPSPKVTSDIGKYTVELETNLPSEIIKHYYSDLKCKIENKFPEKAVIKSFNYAKVVLMDYYPFVKVPDKKDIRQ